MDWHERPYGTHSKLRAPAVIISLLAILGLATFQGLPGAPGRYFGPGRNVEWLCLVSRHCAKRRPGRSDELEVRVVYQHHVLCGRW
jgi:hypothetical protein